MNWTLEVVVVPMADVDRPKAFYPDTLDFAADHDTTVASGNRIVQQRPPGCSCSVVIGEGIVPHMPPGSVRGLQLVVPDTGKARAQLVLLQRPGRQRLGCAADLLTGVTS